MSSDYSQDDLSAELDQRIDFLAEELYDPNTSTKDIDAELCPLFHSINGITDRYQDPKMIGRGGMKEVFRVFDAKTARHVALAKPLPKFSHEHFDAFLREAHVTARLEHPGIIDLYDMGVGKDGRPFFTMECKQGRSLRKLISDERKKEKKSRIPLRKRLEFFLRICEAVAYAHSRRVLHLDIKPSNIQVEESGEVWVCDWGLGVVMLSQKNQDDSAALLDPDLYGPLLTGAKGTPSYMAPEQHDGFAPKTPRMDIYALGCVLHELVTLKSLESPEKSSGVDSALAAIIGKATSTDPLVRYANVNRLLDDMTRYMSDLSISIQDPSLLLEATLFWRRHRETCLAIIGALGIISLCVTLFLLRLQEEKRVAVKARTAAETAEINTNMERAAAVEAQREAETARKQAEEARQDAETARKAAEESLAKYLASKDKAENLLREQGNAAINIIHRATGAAMTDGRKFSITIEEAIDKFDEICEKDPPANSKIWDSKFWLHFIQQDFGSAIVILEKDKVVERDIAKLARKFHPKMDGHKFLPTDDFCDLLSILANQHGGIRAPLAEKMLVYDGNNKRPLKERVQIVQHWVRVINGNSKDIELQYDPATKAIRISGDLKWLTRLRDRRKNRWSLTVNALRFLPINRLDLRETGFEDPSQLENLAFRQLDIRDTKIRDLAPLRKIRTLRLVVVDSEKFHQKQIRALGKWIEVSEK